MFKKKADTNLLHSLSNLEQTDYSSMGEIDKIYKRLREGRDAFVGMYELNINAVAEVSALDLEIKFYIERLMEIARSVSEATGNIHGAASDSTEIAGVVSERHEELTSTIIAVSEKSGNVYEKIDTSQQSLTEIRKLSENTITISQKMNADMNQLSDIINNMNEVIGSINAISAQTNLLSLNASIEAARAGEAGRGFAVVADEIRSLADETKNLTDNMGQFVASVQHAAEESASSVESAIESLEKVNSRIKDVWALNEENQTHLAGITDSISNLATVSEEISSSMNEIESKANEIEAACAVLKNDTEELKGIGDNCEAAIQPIEKIEKGIDNILGHMGGMALDPFYSMSKQKIDGYLDGAIAAHKDWVERLRTIMDTQMIVPLQVDGSKCKFGHYFNSVKISDPRAETVWKEIGSKHQSLHKKGGEIISAMFNEDYNKARNLFDEVEKLSKDVVSKMEFMKNAIPDTGSALYME